MDPLVNMARLKRLIVGEMNGPRAFTPLATCLLIVGLFMASKAAQPFLLEVSARPWLYSLTQKYGYEISRLDQIPQNELQEFANRGVDHLYLLGVWQLGPYGLHHDRTDPGLRKGFEQVLPGLTDADIIGSPFAIVNYTCNSELGSDRDLIMLREKLHSLGIKLILDFVPNHSAVDCPWVKQMPSHYIRAPPGSGPPYDRSRYLDNGIAYGSCGSGCEWNDVAQLNYFDEGLRRDQIDNLLSIARIADGVRVDMAMLMINSVFKGLWESQLDAWGYSVPSTEFWIDAIQAVKRYKPDFVIMGEQYWGYGQKLEDLGFDYVYDKDGLYHSLTSLNVNDVRAYLGKTSIDFLKHGAHFISNHDEKRAAEVFGSVGYSIGAALVTYTLPGLKFNWMWQWEGFKNQLEIHLRREASESPNQKAVDFYSKFLPIVTHKTFAEGEFYMLDVYGSDTSYALLAWRYHLDGGNKRLVVINYTAFQASGRVVVADAEGRAGSDNLTVTDLLTNQSWERSASEMRNQGLGVVIEPWYAQVFEY